MFQVVWPLSTYSIAQIPMLNKKVCWKCIWQERAKLKRWTNVEQRGGEMEKNKSPRKLGESEETGKTKLFQQDWKRGSLNEVLISFWKSWLIGWGGKSAELVLESKFWIGTAVVPFNDKRLPLAEAGFGLSQSYSRNPAEQGSNQAKGFRCFLANTKDKLLTFEQYFQMTFCQ